MSTRLPIIYGAGLFGARGTNANINDLAQAQRLLDVCIQYGVQGIDTSRIYGIGTSEEVVTFSRSAISIRSSFNVHCGSTSQNLILKELGIFPRKPGDHAPERLKELVHESIKALNGIKIRVLYLHAPDRSVPYEDTVKALDELHKEGLFEHFGLSNYLSFEVAEIATICRLKGYVMPTVYQGVYNYLDRTAEPEFAFRAPSNFSLASASMASALLLIALSRWNKDGSHWDTKTGGISHYYSFRYGHAIPALREIKALADQLGLTLNEVAARWLMHHSRMLESDWGIIYGGSKTDQLEATLIDSSKGPLPMEIVAALDEAWLRVMHKVPLYTQITPS
ncbi:hypothetical protein HETIRDRAFT_120225 [Heterobasidion irregulare TC 32-1]|uniref:NADP-dependent oxidoreductase domain-containing protein n=1 Tax=Heterobasidion irregulare (strain TC 32-1) TaxID=747525 RepID=W4JPP4_HETIT|nr:uncharacterized protein HETIRDRAFT_120225 [Heterobasidion irregulare TC 32-1]ETW75439.1 hypothetical protein HETIRDRAFT_120225 [Heterobasidion irregulare TC 32-1]